MDFTNKAALPYIPPQKKSLKPTVPGSLPNTTFWVTSKHSDFGSLPNTIYGSLPNTIYGSLPNTRLGFGVFGNLRFRVGAWGLPFRFWGWHKGNMHLFSNCQDSSTHKRLWWQVIQLSTGPAFRSDLLLAFWSDTSLGFWSDPLTPTVPGHRSRLQSSIHDGNPMSHEKLPLTFHYVGCLIGILIID